MKTFKIEFTGAPIGKTLPYESRTVTVEARTQGEALELVERDFDVMENNDGQFGECVDITREAAAVRALQALSRILGHAEISDEPQQIVRDFFNEYPELAT